MINISAGTRATLSSLGIHDFSGVAPRELFTWHALLTLRGLVSVVVGGFLVGFGTSYAASCIWACNQRLGQFRAAIADCSLRILRRWSRRDIFHYAVRDWATMTKRTVPEYQGCGAETSDQAEVRPAFLVIYLLLGIAFGVVLTRSEVLSWFSIQEMFRFQSFRM